MGKGLIFTRPSAGLSVDSVRPAGDFPLAKDIDLDRYMRDWYVHGHIPPALTRTAHNSVERYRRADDGSIDVRFSFRKGGFKGKQKILTPRGYVVPNTGNAVWAMQFLWPIKMQFLIAYVDADYETTIVARERLDFVWIMASTPTLDEARYADLARRVANMGYDVNAIRRVPQQPGAERGDD